MPERRWCEACRDHFDGSHYDEHGNHRASAEFGPVGEQMMAERDSAAAIEHARELERKWFRLARALIAVDIALSMSDVESARGLIENIRGQDAFPKREPTDAEPTLDPRPNA